MFANQEVNVEVAGQSPFCSAPRPILRLCVLKTAECEVMAFWRPTVRAWGFVETNKKKVV